MMATTTVKLEVRVAWWFDPYLRALIFFCFLTRSEPDWEKLHRVIARALRVRAVVR
jgi:hypothetical protein